MARTSVASDTDGEHGVGAGSGHPVHRVNTVGKIKRRDGDVPGGRRHSVTKPETENFYPDA